MESKITEMRNSEYILTRYGEEYLETIGKRIDKVNEKRSLPNGKWKPATNAEYSLYRRGVILERINGDRPVFDPTSRKYPGKTRLANNAIKKELAKMVRANLVKKVE